ncbi:hypothetical protein BC628DRAFT_1422862 [Trametes gibbosa]|nr:hypothetical protein BC628DRAFT_1422862 [Trametes gibbosa]
MPVRTDANSTTTPTPAGWSVATDGSLIRPLAGSEALHGQNMLGKRYGDVAMGFSFSADVDDLPNAFVNALVRLRYVAPIVAADIQWRDEFPNLLCWVYTPAKDQDAVLKWARRTLSVRESEVSDEDFIAEISQADLPYESHGEHKQYFGCYLVLRPDGKHSFFTQGAHAILDARSNLHVLRHVFQAVVGSDPEGRAENISWGTEVSNLTLDMIHILGEERFAEAQRAGFEIPGSVSRNTCSIGLIPQRLQVANPTYLYRAHRTIDAKTMARLLAKLKATGFSMSVLCDAANLLATAGWNNPLPQDAVHNQDLTHVGLDRYFPPGYAAHRHIGSCSTLLPFISPLRELDTFDAPRRQQLLAAMAMRRKLYDTWLTSPALPFAQFLNKGFICIDANPYVPFLTNIGIVDNFVPPVIGGSGGGGGGGADSGRLPRIDVHELVFGHRLGSTGRVNTHAWTYRGALRVQVQAADLYDADYVEAFLDEFIGWIMVILEDD